MVALLLVTILTQWAWAQGRSDLYANVLAFRIEADRACPLPQ